MGGNIGYIFMNCPICQKSLNPNTRNTDGSITYHCDVILDTKFRQAHYWISYDDNKVTAFQCSVRDMDFRVEYVPWIKKDNRPQKSCFDPGTSITLSDSTDCIVRVSHIFPIDPFNYQEIVALTDTLLTFS